MAEGGELRVRLNGRARTVPEVPDDERLLDLLRWRLGLKGTKEGCRTGDCGACTVLLEGKSVLSCLTLAHEAEGCAIETADALADRSAGGKMVAEAFARSGAVQCGYCTPGFVVAVEGLLRERGDRPPRGVEELAQELGGNLCRCTGYYAILRALAEIVAGSGDQAPGPGPAARSDFEVVARRLPDPAPGHGPAAPPRPKGRTGGRRR